VSPSSSIPFFFLSLLFSRHKLYISFIGGKIAEKRLSDVGFWTHKTIYVSYASTGDIRGITLDDESGFLYIANNGGKTIERIHVDSEEFIMEEVLHFFLQFFVVVFFLFLCLFSFPSFLCSFLLTLFLILLMFFFNSSVLLSSLVFLPSSSWSSKSCQILFLEYAFFRDN